MLGLAAVLLSGAIAVTGAVSGEHLDGLPAYHYNAPIKVECMNRSSSVTMLPFDETRKKETKLTKSKKNQWLPLAQGDG